ncbi:uncharacterized protein ASPGLDRAFT_25145 [Aspergillus glaucus CBS 516.65]|uniref:Velvet domain-containing protein n=1 Tax=Aspergillus glaucus CBS 516.65 TaxID=1160497 RepID=A0A1L9VN41_ASPGL|nr:hypothetical protein ASPGLDRAFT_25145 [Aspergillus glaucus CBS 516.65]OJJ85329.1 hypothetical protein ASPGLDRAFT_25145 [Aspergillus glaucus CBS 516.65]
MVATNGVNGSSSHEYGMTFEITPPTAVRPGAPFTLPVIVAIRSGNPGNGTEQLAANVSLKSESGATVTGLGGPLTSSVRSRNGNTTSGYAKFSPLTISQQPGRYKLRVMLGAASQNGVMAKEFIDSGVITVDGGASASQRPTAAQVSKLRSLTAENIEITDAEIAAWQQA